MGRFCWLISGRARKYPHFNEEASLNVLFWGLCREIEEFNFTEINTATIKRVIETTLKAYEEFNVTVRFHEGTSTNIAVMDLDDDYVSFVT